MFIPRRRSEIFASWALIPIAGIAGIFHELEIPQKIPIPDFRGLLGPWSMQTIRLLPGQTWKISFASNLCSISLSLFLFPWKHLDAWIAAYDLRNKSYPNSSQALHITDSVRDPIICALYKLAVNNLKALLIQGRKAILH